MISNNKQQQNHQQQHHTMPRPRRGLNGDAESFQLAKDNSDSSAGTTTNGVAATIDERQTLMPKGSQKRSSLAANKTNNSDLNSSKREKKVVVKSIENLDENNNNRDLLSLKSSTISSSTEEDGGADESGSQSSSTSIDKCFCFSYSYVVLVGSFFAYMLASLLSTCFGVFFENMESDLGWSKSKVAFIGGLISALQDLTGPISSALTNRFGCRTTAFFGGLIAALGMIGAGYVQEFWLVGFLMGGVAGFGSSLVLVSSVVVVTYYFEEKPSFAAGLTISGGSLGQSIFSLIIIKLNEIYGRSGCFLVLGEEFRGIPNISTWGKVGNPMNSSLLMSMSTLILINGILLNILVCATLFRPLKWELEGSEDDDEEEDEEDDEGEEGQDDNDEEGEDEVEHVKAIEVGSNGGGEKNESEKQSVSPPASAMTPRRQLSAPVAKFDDSRSHSAISGSTSAKSTQLVIENFFDGDLYVRRAQRREADVKDEDDAANRPDASTVSLNPTSDVVATVNNDDEDSVLPSVTKQQLLSYANSMISFDRCHSLHEMKSTPHDESNLMKLNKNQSVPVSLESLRLFRSAQSSIGKSSLNSSPSTSTLTVTRHYHHHHHDMLAVDDEEGERLSSLLLRGSSAVAAAVADGAAEVVLGGDDTGDGAGGEYVVVATADEIEKCGSNLIISSSSHETPPALSDSAAAAAIYFENIFGGGQDDAGDDTVAQLRHTDDVSATIVADMSTSGRGGGIDNSADIPLVTIVNENGRRDDNMNIDEKASTLKDETVENRRSSMLNSSLSHLVTSVSSQNGNHGALFSSATKPLLDVSSLSSRATHSKSSKPKLSSSSKSPESGGIWSLIKKLRPTASKSTTPAVIEKSQPQTATKQNQQKAINHTTDTNAKVVIAAASKKPSSQPANQTAMSSTAAGTASSSVATNRKILVNSNGQKVIRLDNNLYLVRNPMPTAKGSGAIQKPAQKNYIIAKCTCKQRMAAQNMNKISVSSSGGTGSGSGKKPPKTSTNVLVTTTATTTDQTGDGSIKPLIDSQPSGGVVGSVNNNNKQVVTRRPAMRHYSNCPLFYLNVANQRSQTHSHQLAASSSGHNTHNSQHQHHQHHHHSGNKASYYRIPNLFQNSFKVPLHFRNVYYYKSLLNLNMRLIVLRPHGAGALTLKSNAGVGTTTVVHPQGHHHHQHHHNATNRSIHHHHHHSHYAHPIFTGTGQQNNVSLSCPDLNLRQLLIVNKNTMGGDAKTGTAGVPAGGVPSRALTSGQKSSRSRNEYRVLNAGSILLLPGSSPSQPSSEVGVKPTSSATSAETSQQRRHSTIKLTEATVFTTDRRIKKESDLKKSVKSIKPDDEEEEDEDEDEDEEEEDEDENEEDEEEDEVCDNCITRTKYGNYAYRYAYKPMVRPLKFIYISMVENIKLLKLLKFTIFAFCNFILSFFYESPFYFINSFMIENGSSSSQAGTVTVAVGIVSVFSSSDSKKINPIILYSISLILCGCCCCLIPLFIKNYLVTMILMILIGALISVSDVLVPIICVNIVGYDDFVNAYGLMFFCQGLASFSGPPTLGLIVDKSGGYALSYYIIGVGICTSGLVLESILCYDKFTGANKKTSNFKKLDSAVEKSLTLS